MSNVTVYLAVIGKVLIPIPTAQLINLSDFNVRCRISSNITPAISDPERGISIDTSDCTIFTISFPELKVPKQDAQMLREIFEWSVAAVGETIIWNKSIDQIGEVSAFSRQIGTLDVKYCLILMNENDWFAWENPIFSTVSVAHLMNGMLNDLLGGVFDGATMTNGPSAHPLPPISRRVMNSLDLINLGFFTESFINLFSLVDDLTQEVIKKGLEIKGFSADDQNQFLRAIKEERLKVYLCNLAKLCGWASLAEEKPELYKTVVSVNTKRNKIMHGSTRLLRQEAIDSSNILLSLIDWLRSNPFGFDIPNFPLLKVANVGFKPVPIRSGEKTRVAD